MAVTNDYHCHCEPARRLVWQSVLFVARRATRPEGSSVCLRHTQGFALQGMRIATPVCELARNDMLWGQRQHLSCNAGNKRNSEK